MGLGIYIKGEVKKGFHIFKKKESPLEKIASYFERNSKGIFRDFLEIKLVENSLRVQVHPCEEFVYFDLASTNVLIVSSKTNSVGPGYHAYLVEFLEKMGEELNIRWHWDLEENEEYYCDETEYYQIRSFEQLQEKMIHWLQSLIRYFLEENSEHFMISFPTGYPRPKIDYYAISPVGVWSENWLIETYLPETSKVMGKGEEFFIWWNKEADGLFYFQTAVALLNLDCSWHLLVNDEEKRVCILIDKCLTEAARLKADTSVVQKDWNTIKAYLSSNVPVPFHQSAYGYKKNIMTHDLPGKWRIDFPGYFYYQDDDGTDVYCDDVKTIRNTSYSRKDVLNEVDNRIFVETFYKPNELKGNLMFNFEVDEILGKAYIYYYTNPQDTNDQYWIFSGVKSDGEGFIISTLCYIDEMDKDWALDVWRSIVR